MKQNKKKRIIQQKSLPLFNELFQMLTENNENF